MSDANAGRTVVVGGGVVGACSAYYLARAGRSVTLIDAADEGERADIEALGMRVLATDAVMRDEADRARLARGVLAFGAEIRER